MTIEELDEILSGSQKAGKEDPRLMEAAPADRCVARGRRITVRSGAIWFGVSIAELKRIMTILNVHSLIIGSAKAMPTS
ncbi:MAG: hypothetical protein R2867_17445 [Caldilineaceae bacterium]